MPAHRKSLDQHALHNTKPHDRAADTSHVPSGRPRFPKDLDKSLRPVFKRICRLLQERRALTSADGELIRLYCLAYDRHERNVALLRQEGELCTYIRLDSNGVAHPQVKTNLRLKVCSDAERQMADALNKLGFTPTAKDRAKPTSGAQTDEIIPGSMADLMPELVRKAR
jgi:P27 family predicted phage terminase small subunit